MKYIIKVKKQYLGYVICQWAHFTAFRCNAHRFEDEESANEAVDSLLANGVYRNFGRKDVSVIPYNK